MKPLVFRLPGAADVVVYVRGAAAWVLDRAEVEKWVPLTDPPLAVAGVVLTPGTNT